MNDYQLGDTLYFNFTTRAFATGIPTVLAGTPVISIYEDDSVTQITAGITLTVSLDSVVGLNNIAVVATTANGFEAGKFYSAVITTGTVGGVSVVGETVGSFSLNASTGGIAVTPQLLTRAKGATSQIIPFSVQDSRSTIGAKLDGLLFNSAGLTASANRIGSAGAATAITLVTATKGTWTSSGFIAIDGTNMPGDYELHAPDALLATGADGVWIRISGADNMVPVEIYIDLVAEIDLGSDNGVLVSADAHTSGQTIQAVTGDTKQTGDNFVRLGTPIDTDIATDIDNVASAVSGIGSGSGSALNFPVSADNTAGAIIGGVTFVGSQTGTFTNTLSDFSTFHQITHSGNAFDLVYRIACGATFTAVSITIDQYMNSSNDVMDIQVWDHIATGWDTFVSGFTGTNGSTVENLSLNIFSQHTGALGTAEAGNVYARFVTTGQTAPVLFVAKVSAAAVSAASAGYEGFIWIDTNASNTGTVANVDGISNNPVSTLAAAVTLSADPAVNLNRFNMAPGSSITLASTFANYLFKGEDGWVVALGGQDISDTTFIGASVSGIATGTGVQKFRDCLMGAVSLPAESHILNSGIGGTQTLPVGDIFYDLCHSGVAGSGAPIFDFGAAIGTTNFNQRHYSGGMHIHNMGQSGTDTASIEGVGQVIYNVNCIGGSVSRRGSWLLTDNSGGAVTETLDDNTSNNAAIVIDTGTTIPGLIGTPAADLSADIAAVKADTAATLVDTAEIGIAGVGLTDLGGMSTAMKAEVNAEADTALTDYDPPTNAEMEARTPTAAQLAYITANAETGLPVTFTTAGGSTTAAVLALVDGDAGSATDDQYNSRLLVFTDGTLKGVVTDITDYVGSTTTATITAIPTAPTSSHNARLI